MKKKEKYIITKKNYVFLYIVLLTLLISIVINITYSKYTSEFKQTPFNIEFIAGDIKLSFTDSDNEFKIIPGKVISKDTKLTVEAESEACYLFIKFQKPDNFDTYIEYEMEDGWNEFNGSVDAYYYESPKTTENTDIYIFKDNQIEVKETVTKEDIEALNGNSFTINFTVYAVQKTNEIATVEDAWELINN